MLTRRLKIKDNLARVGNAGDRRSIRASFGAKRSDGFEHLCLGDAALLFHLLEDGVKGFKVEHGCFWVKNWD